MKDTLGEDPATLGRAGALGAIALLVTCKPPCRRQSSISIAILGLPSDTPFDQIATLKRFVCKECGRRATSVSVDWDAKVESPFGTWGVDPPR